MSVDTVLKTVNFGTSKAGLSTVGYTIYDDTGTEVSARSTTGVTEIGSLGMYFAKITYNRSFDRMIVWDTGEGSPLYALDIHYGQDFEVFNETSKIKIIWNTIQNQAPVFQKIVDVLNTVMGKASVTKGFFGEVRDPIIKKLDSMGKNRDPSTGNGLTRKDVEGAIESVLGGFKIDIPKVRVPDHRKDFNDIAQQINNIKAEIGRIPKDKAPDFKDELNKLKTNLQFSMTKVPLELKPIVGAVLIEVKKAMIGNERSRSEAIDTHKDLTKTNEDVKKMAEEVQANNNKMNQIIQALDLFNVRIKEIQEVLSELESSKVLLEAQALLASIKGEGSKKSELRRVKLALGRK